MRNLILACAALFTIFTIQGATLAPYNCLEEAKLLPLDGESSDNFGNSVSINGDYCIVGSTGDDDYGSNSGSAYIFVRDGENLIQQSKLLASDGEASDNFGNSVSINGDYCIVGSVKGDDDSGLDSGSAYVFVRDGNNWIQQSKLLASDGGYEDKFGNSVSINGDYCVVGSKEDDDNGRDSGSAYIFRREGDNWIQQSKLLLSDGGRYDNFGRSVSINGNYCIVGAPYDDDSGLNSGSAYIFVRDGDNWIQQSKLLPSDGEAYDIFGASVSINGDYCIVGAINGDDDNGFSSGSAYVFIRDGENWIQQSKLLASDGEASDKFGTSVSINGDYCVVGSKEDGDNGRDSGSAYVFVRDGDNWIQLSKLLASDGDTFDRFGGSVSMTGDYCIVGSINGDDDNGSNSGSAYIYINPELNNLVDLEITGPQEVGAKCPAYAYYTVFAVSDKGCTKDVMESVLWWVEPDNVASIDESGLLTINNPNEPRDITIYAQYTEGDVTIQEQLIVKLRFSKTLHVPTDYETIQDAINAAANCDDIIVVADGVYTGEGNRRIRVIDKVITVRSANGPENCIIDCQGLDYGFFIGNRGVIDGEGVIEGFTITNGSGGRFGAIVIGGRSRSTIANCIITNCSASYGGGIYCGDESSSTITNCIISQNSTDRLGGGGIYCDESKATIINCIISGNTAGQRDGGGIVSKHSEVTIINSQITGNTAGRNGGGIYYISDNAAAKLIIIDSIIEGNKSLENGGAMYLYGRTATLTNCTITGNQAVNGGAVYNTRRLTATNCTITSNVAENDWGGIFCHEESLQLRLTNCILWANTDSNGTGEFAQLYGGIPEVTFSCIQDDDSNDTYIPFGGENNQNIDDDPMFVRNPDDGGDGWGIGDNDDYGDLHLTGASPCINAGLPNFTTSESDLDMDGQPRVMGLRVDIGADEYEKIIVVTKPAGGEVWTAGSIHEVEWSSYGAETVDILLSTDAGGSWQTIEGAVADTGVYTWQLPGSADSNQCLVNIVPSVPDANAIIIESGLFSIVPFRDRPHLPQGRQRPKKKFGPELLNCVKWQFETEGPVTASVTIARNSRVYIPCEDGKLYVLNAGDGTLRWSYDVNTPLASAAAVGTDGTVYVGDENGKLYAIDKKGKLLWTHTTDGPIYSSPVISSEGQVYICSLDGKLHALDRDGTLLWTFETDGFGAIGGSVFAAPRLASDGTVYIAGLYDPNLYALDLADGGLKWNCNFEFPADPCDPNSDTKTGWPFASPAVAKDGTIYQTLMYDNNLYAIEPESGTIIWATDLSDPCSGFFEPNYLDWDYLNPPPYWYLKKSAWTSELVLAPDGTIYVSFEDPYLRAVEPNGSLKWATKLGEDGGFTLSVADDGLIYAACDDNQLYVVDPTGEQVAQFEGSGWLSFPVLALGHTLIVSDANNTVWAIGDGDCSEPQQILHRRRVRSGKPEPTRIINRRLEKNSGR